jgi:hypothetical protein
VPAQTFRPPARLVGQLQRFQTKGDGEVNFAFALSLVLAGLAVVGVFVEIPFVSDYAFWIAIAAYVILAGT